MSTNMSTSQRPLDRFFSFNTLKLSNLSAPNFFFVQWYIQDVNTPSSDWLIDWLIDWLTDWLTDWLIDWMIDLLIH